MLAEMIAAAVREGRKADAFRDKQDYQMADASWGEQNHQETASVKKVDIE